MATLLNQLMLLSGNAVPLPAAQLTIHVPTIKEIAFIGQQSFYGGVELLTFTKDRMSTQDKTNLEKYSNFDILMAILEDKTPETHNTRQRAMLVLTLLFPDFEVSIKDHNIYLEKDNEEPHVINNECGDDFREIILQIFKLDSKAAAAYKPTGDLASRIADKLNKGRAKASKQQHRKVSILSRYISILSVGEQKDINMLMNYTVCQLYEQFQRYQAKLNYDMWVQQKMAGAKNLKEVKNWMTDLNEQQKDDFEAVARGKKK